MKSLMQKPRPLAIIAVATCVLILGSNWLSLGAFGVTSISGIIGLALGLTALAQAIYVCVALAVCLPLRLTEAGMLLQTVFGIIAGSLAIWFIGMFVPGVVLLGGMLAAVPYAIANTGMIWLIAGITGSLREGLTLFPKR